MVAGISYRKFLSLVTGLGLALLVGSVLTSTAWALSDVQLDLRNGTTDKVAVTSPTAVVNSEFYTVVNGTNGTTSDDRINFFVASIYSSTGLGSSDPGIIYGSMALAWSDAFMGSSLYDETVPPPGVAPLCYLGTSQELNADGDPDIGSTDNGDATSGWIHPYAPTTGPIASSGLTPPGFDIGTVTFTGTGWVAGNHGVTKLFIVNSTGFADTIYKKDGVVGGNTAETGRLVTLYRPATAVVGPTLTLGVATPTGLLGGTGSTGTIGTWEWLIDGKATGLTGDNPNVSWNYLVYTLGLTPDATYGVTLNLGSGYETGITPGTGFITLEATPEPATLTLMAFGALAMLSRRRRRSA